MRGIRTRITAVALTGAVTALAVAPGIAAAKPTGGPSDQLTSVTLGALLKRSPSFAELIAKPLPPKADMAAIIAALRPHLGDLVALNPQPLPPGPPDKISPVALNPQPLPPHPDEASIIAKLRPQIGDLVAKLPHRGDEVALNPQPLPPGPPDKAGEVALNPQPLPPGPDDISPVALNPQPLPPQPDELNVAQLELPQLQVGP
ncbi:MAG TPA: hypothetical protein VGJ32_10120 [Solirubrobacteraceae bacterium]